MARPDPPSTADRVVGRRPEVTSRIMSAVRSKNTAPELTLRRAIHARGARFRLHAPDVPGRPDIVFRSKKIAVFVDGDLWHGNPDEWRRRGRKSLAEMFPTRTEWWVAKIEGNMRRDREVDRQLTNAGWQVIRLWASDIAANTDATADAIVSAVRAPR